MKSIDDSSLYKSRFSPVCSRCKHLNDQSAKNGKPVCNAFPQGVPKVVWTGKNNHTSFLPGDRGIRFEPR